MLENPGLQKGKVLKIALYLTFSLICFTVKAQQEAKFTAYSNAFVDNGIFPKLYTCDSSALSPPVFWKNIPAGTKSFAITMHHIPRDGDKHVYMVLYNIPADKTGIPQQVKGIGVWGHNSLNPFLAYSPPCSKGPGEKAYIITVYAISRIVNDNGSALTMDNLKKAIADCTLASATLTVKYSR